MVGIDACRKSERICEREISRTKIHHERNSPEGFQAENLLLDYVVSKCANKLGEIWIYGYFAFDMGDCAEFLLILCALLRRLTFELSGLPLHHPSNQCRLCACWNLFVNCAQSLRGPVS